MNPILSSLPPNEREALATCGILNDGQLAEVDVNSLLRDLEMAKEAFPEARFSLPENKLRRLCAAAKGEVGQQAAAPQNTVPETEKIESADDGLPTANVSEPGDDPLRALPELSLRSHQHRRNSRQRHSANLSEAPGVDSSVHCSRPISTYLAALSMVAFYVGITSLFLLPFLIFTGYMRETMLIPVAGAGAALVLPYIFFGVWCHCCVCKMRMFRLIHYNLNRHAHKIPFLGLTTLVTALHIILFRWYRCPACGTAIRLFRSRHSHH